MASVHIVAKGPNLLDDALETANERLTVVENERQARFIHLSFTMGRNYEAMANEKKRLLEENLLLRTQIIELKSIKEAKFQAEVTALKEKICEITDKIKSLISGLELFSQQNKEHLEWWKKLYGNEKEQPICLSALAQFVSSKPNYQIETLWETRGAEGTAKNFLPFLQEWMNIHSRLSDINTGQLFKETDYQIGPQQFPDISDPLIPSMEGYTIDQHIQSLRQKIIFYEKQIQEIKTENLILCTLKEDAERKYLRSKVYHYNWVKNNCITPSITQGKHLRLVLEKTNESYSQKLPFKSVCNNIEINTFLLKNKKLIQEITPLIIQLEAVDAEINVPPPEPGCLIL